MVIDAAAKTQRVTEIKRKGEKEEQKEGRTMLKGREREQ